ncbi:MAG TPA: proton-conducting transporter membrane subunit [Negativicutes bacterium]|nr:proton-conducting transporter membrane subunit [Negativicutes bacterium]
MLNSLLMLDNSMLLFVLVALPFIAGFLCLALRNHSARAVVVVLTSVVLMIASVGLLLKGSFQYTMPEQWNEILTYLDFALLAYILFQAFYSRKFHAVYAYTTVILALISIAMVYYFDFFMAHGAKVDPTFWADQLSVIMVMIISIVGSLICIFGIPYMKDHEHHLHLSVTRQPRFFMYLVLFLGAMNGIVLANNLVWLLFFWEITTLCSFMLIGHDKTEIATVNGLRAICLNMLGGVGFTAGVMLLFNNTHSLSLIDIISGKIQHPLMILPLALMVFAGMTKAAQLPFQSWLLGAMVAPTPVSALLHSSTMVKAGVYLIVRLAPAYADTWLSVTVAVAGAITFVVTSALAVGQSNGKKVLAYSTIANLGLIVVCAGLNTPLAYAGAVILIIFHAVSKALLFLCVGTIEHGIGSRDIEDMHGLVDRMPLTAVISVIGMITMFLPPFGMLIGKWTAMEAAAMQPLLLFLLILGSAITIVFWLRWAGILLSTSSRPAPRVTEPLSILTKTPLVALAAAAIVLNVVVIQLYNKMIAPVATAYYTKAMAVFSANAAAPYGSLLTNLGASNFGSFTLYPLFGTIFVIILISVYAVRKADATHVVTAPYMCGEIGDNQEEQPRFRAIGDGWVEYKHSNYYMNNVFGEEVLTTGSNILAIVAILAMFYVSYLGLMR